MYVTKKYVHTQEKTAHNKFINKAIKDFISIKLYKIIKKPAEIKYLWDIFIYPDNERWKDCLRLLNNVISNLTSQLHFPLLGSRTKLDKRFYVISGFYY